jgi:H+/gluconate symporter-like permease
MTDAVVIAVPVAIVGVCCCLIIIFAVYWIKRKHNEKTTQFESKDEESGEKDTELQENKSPDSDIRLTGIIVKKKIGEGAYGAVIVTFMMFY